MVAEWQLCVVGMGTAKSDMPSYPAVEFLGGIWLATNRNGKLNWVNLCMIQFGFSYILRLPPQA